MYDLAITQGRVYQNGGFCDANVYIKSGRIEEVTASALPAREAYSAQGRLVLPGFIDPHVHFSMPAGACSTADTFATGSVAGAFGGVTTYIDFCECACDARGIRREFDLRMSQARGSVTDFAFHASVAEPKEDARTLVRAAKSLGMATVKVYSTYKESASYCSDDEIGALLDVSAEERVRILVHAEKDELLVKAGVAVRDHAHARPAISETAQVLTLAQRAKASGANLYIVHVSAGSTVDALRAFYGDLLYKNILLESCPHYFVLTDEKYKAPDGYLYTMAPPLRSDAERLALIRNLDAIGVIGTDHCTFLAAEKQKSLTADIPMGIGGVECSFKLMYSLFGDKIIDKFTKNPAQAHGLYPRKGVIAPGADADFAIFDPNPASKPDSPHSACDYSVYQGIETRGEIVSTIVRGQFAVRDRVLCKSVGQYINAAL